MTVEPWIETESGIAFDLLTPRVEDVSLVDIAGHLSKINRYAGATLGPIGYTVAQHSVHVSRILEVWGAPLDVQREGLLHDAPEAYYGDVSTPVQRAMRDLWRASIDDAFSDAIAVAEERFTAMQGRQSVIAILVSMRDALEQSDPFRALKGRVDPVVRGALGLPLEGTAIVKRADLVALACERYAIMAPCARDWNLPEFADTRWRTIGVLDAPSARHGFTERLKALDCAIENANREASAP